MGCRIRALQATAIEAGKVLDTLAALSVRLSCRCDVAPDTLVLDAGKVKEACDAIDDAVLSLKRILVHRGRQRHVDRRRQRRGGATRVVGDPKVSEA